MHLHGYRTTHNPYSSSHLLRVVSSSSSSLSFRSMSQLFALLHQTKCLCICHGQTKRFPLINIFTLNGYHHSVQTKKPSPQPLLLSYASKNEHDTRLIISRPRSFMGMCACRTRSKTRGEYINLISQCQFAFYADVVCPTSPSSEALSVCADGAAAITVIYT